MIFLDTSFIFASASEEDINHRKAADLFKLAVDNGEDLVLHNYIVVECLALFDRRLGRVAAQELLGSVKKFRIHWITQEEHALAAEVFAATSSKRYSFTDIVSFLFMRSYGISEYLSFDSDFDKEGFKMFGWKIH